MRDRSCRPARASGGIAGLLLAMTLPMACTDATDVELLQIEGAGGLAGQAYLDFDLTGTLTAGDFPYAAIEVVLRVPSTGAEVARVVTDSIGGFVFSDIAIGTYVLGFDSTTLGDSLVVVDEDPVGIPLADTALTTIGVSYPIVSIEQVFSVGLGNPVYTSGIALNSRFNFDPTGQVHLAGDSLYLRATNVERAGIQRGDSVRFLGRVRTDNGRTVLDDVTVFPLVPQASVVTPVNATVADAAVADGGRLDAALVRIGTAEITDTTTSADGHFRFWAVQGGDSIEIVLRSFLGFNTSVVWPDSTIRISSLTGLLTPFDDGSAPIRWTLLPREGVDVVLEPRIADIALTASLDTAAASLGDTVEVTIVAGNLGPLDATSLAVQDSLPGALTYLSSTVTSGSYAPGSGVWTVGPQSVGASDTLRILAEVTTGTPGQTPIPARVLPSAREQDPGSPGANSIVLILTIS